MTAKLRVSSVAWAAFNLTSSLDHGPVVQITIDEIRKEIKDGSLIAFLNEKLSNYDWSLFGPEFDQGSPFVEAMQFEADVFEGREGRKLGIRNSGICLLLAFCIEAMQQLDGDKNYYQKSK